MPKNNYPISDDDKMYQPYPRYGITRRLREHPLRPQSPQGEPEQATTRRNNFEHRSRPQPRQEPLYDENDHSPQETRRHPSHNTGCGWTLPLGAGMFIMMIVWLGWSGWNQYQQNQAQQQAVAADAKLYGTPRTFTTSGLSADGKAQIEYRSVNKAENRTGTACTITIARSDGKTWVLLNAMHIQTFDATCQQYVGILKVEDVNHDGLPDLVITVKAGLKTLSVLYMINDGKGGYHPPTS